MPYGDIDRAQPWLRHWSVDGWQQAITYIKDDFHSEVQWQPSESNITTRAQTIVLYNALSEIILMNYCNISKLQGVTNPVTSQGVPMLEYVEYQSRTLCSGIFLLCT